ncbi:MAG: glutathione peroxidase [Bacteroidia bacterium]|jgi:glutathione peroxidase|nr:glutathione peroxidase [Bacteroidia bacterium]
MNQTLLSPIYAYTVQTLEGTTVSLSEYQNKVLLIVNTASECGFTPQYQQLEELYKLYSDKGFAVLAFPSNDFGRQEPLQGQALQSFCSLHFRTTFPVFDRVHVKGPMAHPLFQFLSNRNQNGTIGIAPKWNFHKYLVDRNGKVVDYFFPFTKPTSPSIKKAIEKLL